MARLSRDEARASLILAIEARPVGWVARELASTLARLEFAAGAAMMRQTLAEEANARIFFALEARREHEREARA